jgi:hypothetical protein
MPACPERAADGWTARSREDGGVGKASASGNRFRSRCRLGGGNAGLGLGAFDRGVAAGRAATAAVGGGVAAFGAGAGFTVGLGVFGGFATARAFGLGFAARVFAVRGNFALRLLLDFLDGLGFVAAARVPFAFLSGLCVRDALALLGGAFALRVPGARALRALPFARRDRGGAFFFLRTGRGAAFLAEARRVLDLAIARGPFSRRRLTKCR